MRVNANAVAWNTVVTKAVRLASVLVLTLVFGARLGAQVKPNVDENGSIIAWGESGWSFGLPNVQAVAEVQDLNTGFTSFVVSPQKKTLAAPSFGVGVKVGKHLLPFVSVTLYDTGSAFATNGPVTANVSCRTFSYNGGLRVEGCGTSILRPYVEFGGGALSRKVSGSGSFFGQSQFGSASAKNADVFGGVGVRTFWGKSRWGSDFGVDWHRLIGQNLFTHNFAQAHIGIFFQSKRANQ